MVLRLDVEMSAAGFLRGCIENRLDLEAWRATKAEFDADPVTFSAAEIAAK